MGLVEISPGVWYDDAGGSPVGFQGPPTTPPPGATSDVPAGWVPIGGRLYRAPNGAIWQKPASSYENWQRLEAPPSEARPDTSPTTQVRNNVTYQYNPTSGTWEPAQGLPPSVPTGSGGPTNPQPYTTWKDYAGPGGVTYTGLFDDRTGQLVPGSGFPSPGAKPAAPVSSSPPAGINLVRPATEYANDAAAAGETWYWNTNGDLVARKPSGEWWIARDHGNAGFVPYSPSPQDQPRSPVTIPSTGATYYDPNTGKQTIIPAIPDTTQQERDRVNNQAAAGRQASSENAASARQAQSDAAAAQRAAFQAQITQAENAADRAFRAGESATARAAQAEADRLNRAFQEWSRTEDAKQQDAQFKATFGIQRANALLAQQQQRGQTAKDLASVVSSSDPLAFTAWLLAKGGGVAENAISTGTDALSKAAILPAAKLLRLSREPLPDIPDYVAPERTSFSGASGAPGVGQRPALGAFQPLSVSAPGGPPPMANSGAYPPAGGFSSAPPAGATGPLSPPPLVPPPQQLTPSPASGGGGTGFQPMPVRGYAPAVAGGAGPAQATTFVPGVGNVPANVATQYSSRGTGLPMPANTTPYSTYEPPMLAGGYNADPMMDAPLADRRQYIGRNFPPGWTSDPIDSEPQNPMGWTAQFTNPDWWEANAHLWSALGNMYMGARTNVQTAPTPPPSPPPPGWAFPSAEGNPRYATGYNTPMAPRTGPPLSSAIVGDAKGSNPFAGGNDPEIVTGRIDQVIPPAQTRAILQGRGGFSPMPIQPQQPMPWWARHLKRAAAGYNYGQDPLTSLGVGAGVLDAGDQPYIDEIYGLRRGQQGPGYVNPFSLDWWRAGPVVQQVEANRRQSGYGIPIDQTMYEANRFKPLGIGRGSVYQAA